MPPRGRPVNCEFPDYLGSCYGDIRDRSDFNADRGR